VTHPLRWDPDLTKAERHPSILHDPLRAGLAAAGLAIVIGCTQPWAEGTVGYQPQSVGGFEGAGDGAILLFLAIILLFMARDRGFVDARDGARRYLPMIAGLICLGDWVIARQGANFLIEGWLRTGGTGSLAPGFYLAGLGSLGAAVVGSVASLRKGEGRTGGPGSLIRVPRRSDVPTLVASLGLVVGFLLGAGLALSVFPATVVGAPLVFLAGLGAIAGAYVGRSIGRWLGRPLS
jgi:hypothetical protein